MLVAVHGSYFARNYGDTLLVKVLCDMVANLIGREKVVLACPGNIKEQAEIGYRVCKERERNQVTHLIYAGGGYFGEPIDSIEQWTERCRKRHLAWLDNYKQARRLVIGVGFGPITNNSLRKDILELFNDSDYVLVRDKESLEYMKDYGYNKKNVGTCVDLALMPILQNFTKFNDKKSIDKIGIHLPNTSSETKARLIGSISNFFDSANASYTLLRDSHTRNPFKNAIFKDEVKMFKRSATIARARIKDVASFTDLISGLDLIITDKLHVGIVGLAHGVKVISVGKHPKIIRLYSQLELNDFYISDIENNIERFDSTLDLLNSYTVSLNEVHDGINSLVNHINKFLDIDNRAIKDII